MFLSTPKKEPVGKTGDRRDVSYSETSRLSPVSFTDGGS